MRRRLPALNRSSECAGFSTSRSPGLNRQDGLSLSSRPLQPLLRLRTQPLAGQRPPGQRWAWAWQWLDNGLDERNGRMTTPLQKRRQHLVETQRFFRELVAGSRGYDVVDAGLGAGFWKDTDMHNSLNRRVYLLRRRSARVE